MLLHRMNTKLKGEVLRHIRAIEAEDACDGRERSPQLRLTGAERGKLRRIAEEEGTELDLMEFFPTLMKALYGYYGIKPLVRMMPR